MQFQVLASGSGGNALWVRHKDLSLLVDVGLTHNDLVARLEQAGLDAIQIQHVLVTHGHLDHARGAGILARALRCPVHCSEAIHANASIRRGKQLRGWSPGRPAELTATQGEGRLLARAVLVSHDADPTYAVRLEADGRVLCLVTDLGEPCLAPELIGAHVLLLEFNHDLDLLEAGPYSAALKRRVRGSRGHLSNAQASQQLEALLGPELHTLVLCHLSKTNNSADLARSAAEATLARLDRQDVRVVIAEQDRIGERFEV